MVSLMTLGVMNITNKERGRQFQPQHIEEGMKLAGQAAIRTTDRTAMVTLLERARTLQGPSSTSDQRQPTASPGEAVLSERERQVAELVVSGLTYRQIGDRLFISAKTVEHHMARRNMGAGHGLRHSPPGPAPQIGGQDQGVQPSSPRHWWRNRGG